MLVIKIEHYVKLIDFAKALSENFYNKNESFNKALTKTEAMKILKWRLFFHGLEGELESGHFEASGEQGEIWNEIFSDAVDWVAKNYPYLTENKG